MKQNILNITSKNNVSQHFDQGILMHFFRGKILSCQIIGQSESILTMTTEVMKLAVFVLDHDVPENRKSNDDVLSRHVTTFEIQTKKMKSLCAQIDSIFSMPGKGRFFKRIM